MGRANDVGGRVLAAPDALRMWLLRQPVFTSTILPRIPRSVRWMLRKVYFLPVDLAERLFGERDELVPQRSQIFAGAVEGFRSSGDRVVQHLVESAGLTPASHVLDVGCGNGRLAVALTAYLDTGGSYDGLDIVKSGIEWCRSTISPRFPQFRFAHADIYNSEYNPHGLLRPAEYVFPYPDSSFDVAVLISVFTHMLRRDMEHYVSELARVLRPGGRCFATFFLLNEESRRLMSLGQSSLLFQHALDGCSVVNPSVPELSVAYDEAVVADSFEQRGFSLRDGFRYGGWCGRTPLWGAEAGPGDQDVVVAVRS